MIVTGGPARRANAYQSGGVPSPDRNRKGYRTVTAPSAGASKPRLSAMTSTQRSMDSGEPLTALLGHAAYTAGVDWKARVKDGMYEFTGFAGASRVEGDSLAIQRRSPSLPLGSVLSSTSHQ